MADEFRFVALRAFAGPPRLLVVVPYVEALWVRWAAAGLGALSQVWGGCAGAVIPAPVADHPALAGLLRRMQPDHVLGPYGATVETIRLGVIDRALGDLEGDARRQSETLVRAEPWRHHEALVGVPVVALSDHPVGFRCALRDARRMNRLTAPPPPRR